MARDKYGKTRTVPHRRHRQGKTHYKKRLALLKSGQQRLVIRTSLNQTITQIIQYHPDGDKILVSATSKELNKLCWKLHTANIPSAYLTGLLLGMKAKKNKVTSAILDLGLQSPIHGGRINAALKGVFDSGIKINCSEEVFPPEERLNGNHISKYADKLKKEGDKYNKQFSRCVKVGVKPEDTSKLFEELKNKIKSM